MSEEELNTTCPVMIRPRGKTTDEPCPNRPHYIVTAKDGRVFRTCSVHKGRYIGAGGSAVESPLPKAKRAPKPPSTSSVSSTPLVTMSSSSSSLSSIPPIPLPSLGIKMVPQAPSKPITPPARKASSSTPSTPSTPTPTTIPKRMVAMPERTGVVDKMLHPLYAEMFAAACNMRIRQKNSASYSSDDRKRILSMQSMEEDVVDNALKDGKTAKRALQGEKALQEMADRRRGAAPQEMMVQQPQPTPPQYIQQPPQQMAMGMAPQFLMPTYTAPSAPSPFIDAPMPPIGMQVGSMLMPPSSTSAPIVPPPPTLVNPGIAQSGMVEGPDGVVRFQEGGVPLQPGETPVMVPPPKLEGNALLDALKQNRQGIEGFCTVLEMGLAFLGFPQAVGTTKRLIQDPSFEQCLQELVDPGLEEAEGKKEGVMGFFEMKADDHPMMKIAKKWVAHATMNTANSVMGKVTMQMSGDVMSKAKEEANTLLNSTPPPSADTSVTAPPEEHNEMMPSPMPPGAVVEEQRQEAPQMMMPTTLPLPSTSGNLYKLQSFRPNIAFKAPGDVPIEPLYAKKVEPPPSSESDPNHETTD